MDVDGGGSVGVAPFLARGLSALKNIDGLWRGSHDAHAGS